MYLISLWKGMNFCFAEISFIIGLTKAQKYQHYYYYIAWSPGEQAGRQAGGRAAQFVPLYLIVRLVRYGVSKRVEDGRRPPQNGLKAVSGVARPQGVEG
jgi:hypothetical protein